VSEEAAAALDPVRGLFVISSQPRRVSSGFVDSLAVAVGHFFGRPDPFGIGARSLERDRGAPIDFAHLHRCERRVLAVSPFGDFPAPVPGVVRRIWGDQFAVPLCGSEETVQVSVGVPDNATDMSVAADTLVIKRSSGGGGDFNATGVPPRYPFGFPLTPEGAVQFVYAKSSKRIVSVPTLFDQHDPNGIGQLPLCGSWRIRIEQPVQVSDVATGAITQASEFYVRPVPGCYSDEIGLFVAETKQPTSQWLLFLADTVNNSAASGLDSALVPLSGPTKFTRVTVAP